LTVQTVIVTMNQLSQLHESLLSISRKKTEALKSNDTDELQHLLTQERKHVQAITQVDGKRAEAVDQWYQSKGLIPQEPSISEMLGYLEVHDKDQLQGAYEGMILVLSNLKEQEKLNKELTQQSLQFIKLSLDMLQPTLGNVNYGNKSVKSEQPNRSVFDSKA
jgi:hypothetical protein